MSMLLIRLGVRGQIAEADIKGRRAWFVTLVGMISVEMDKIYVLSQTVTFE